MNKIVVRYCTIACFVLISAGNFLFSQVVDNGFRIIKSDENCLIVSFSPIIRSIDTIIATNGSKTILPNIANASMGDGSLPGTPRVLYVNGNITVPGENGFVLESFYIKGYKSISGIMAPVPSLRKSGEIFEEIYNSINNNINSQNNNSLKDVELNYGGIARNMHLATLKIIAAKYNSANNTIEIPTEVIITIKFIANPKNISGVIKDDILPVISLNQNVTKKWLIPENNSNTNSITINNQKENHNRLLGLTTDTWLKIAIDKEGIYKIDASSISGMGYSLPKDKISTIKVFGNNGKELSETVSDAAKNQMHEQPVIIRTNNNGDLESIIFYASGPTGFQYDGSIFKNYFNHYCDKNYYLLTWGEDAGKRSDPVSLSVADVKNKPSTYTERIFFKEELNCALVGGSGRVWFGGSVFPRTFNNMLYNLDTSGITNYRFYVAHRANPDGNFVFTDNGKPVGTITVPGIGGTQYLDANAAIKSFTLPAKSIPNDNRSIININYANSESTSLSSFFNWYEIHYPRSFVPVDNQIGFWTDPKTEGTTEYNINFGNTGEIIGFDVTSPESPQQIKNESVTGGIFIFKCDLQKNVPKRFFVASNFLKPELSETNIAGIRTNYGNSDIILITNKLLLNSAQKYKEYRESHDNLKVNIVTTEQIFNEFNSGVTDPTAIRDFVAFAFNNWQVKPLYVILWGDGHYDYKNITTKVTNFVPPYESYEYDDTFQAESSYTSDDYYVLVNGDDRYIDLAVGRITIQSDNDGLAMIDKIKTYENNSSKDNWRSFSTLVADDSPTSDGKGDGTTHTGQSEHLSKYCIPEYMQLRKIYEPEYPCEYVQTGRRRPAVTQDLLSYANNYGSVLLNWVGHGNPRVWAHEEIFDRDKTTPQLKNLNKLFFNTAATCDFGRYDMTETTSGAEALFTSKVGGSIGEFVATRVVYSGDNASINEEFHNDMFKRLPVTKEYPRLGDIMFQVKQNRPGSNDRKYNLLGDPSLRLLLPYYMVAVDSINTVDIRNGKDTVSLKALSKVTVTASVINPVDSSLMSDFNGQATITIYDADYSIIAHDIDGTDHPIVKFGGVLNKSTVDVIKGKITTTFYLPEDISYINDAARFYIYAYSDNNKFANGITRKLKIIGVDTTKIDVNPPVVKIYIDSLSFMANDFVSDTPLAIVRVSDKYGVNTTGSGIGHRIEAWIDDNPISIDLTDKFLTIQDFQNSLKTIETRQLLFSLAPGTHKIKVRAWNIFNKFATDETTFRIGNNIVVSDVLVSPNPFSQVTTIKFQHNQNQPFRAILNIYAMNGVRVNTIDKEITSIHTSEIQWDGKDKSGDLLAQGLYIYQLSIYTSTGDNIILTGKIVYIR